MSGKTEMKSMSTAMIVFASVLIIAFVAVLVILIVLMISPSIRINFFTTQQAKLMGTGNIGNAQLGTSVALSRDGNTLAVGATDNNANVGAVWIFVRNVDTKIWTQQQILIPSDGAPGLVGNSVAISDDGNTVVTGSLLTPGGVWIFGRVGTVWTQESLKIFPVTYPLISAFPQFGYAVSISGDGKVVVIGAKNDDGGSVYVYEKICHIWTEKQKLIGTGAIGFASQGASVCISEDKNVIAFGGTSDNGSFGAAWIFMRCETTHSYFQVQKVFGSGVVGINNSQQGHSVALSSDGSVLAVGGWADDANRGAVWIFKREGALWVQQGQKLVGSGLSTNYFSARRVALNGEGNILAVSVLNRGFFIFINDGNSWIQKENSMTVPSGAIGASYFSESLSMSRDGKNLAVGAERDTSNLGAAFIFV